MLKALRKRDFLAVVFAVCALTGCTISVGPSDETTTYRDPGGKFSVEYPSNWEPVEGNPQTIGAPDGADVSVVGFSSGGTGPVGFVNQLSGGSTEESHLQLGVIRVGLLSNGVDSSAATVDSMMERMVSGLPGYERISATQDADGGTTAEYRSTEKYASGEEYLAHAKWRILDSGDDRFIVYGTAPEDEFAGYSSDIDAFLASLTSLQGVPASNTPSPNGSWSPWQTYQSPEQSFSVDYPAEWSFREIDESSPAWTAVGPGIGVVFAERQPGATEFAPFPLPGKPGEVDFRMMVLVTEPIASTAEEALRVMRDLYEGSTITSRSPGYKVLRYGPVEVDGHQGFEYSFTINANVSGVPTTQRMVVFIEGGHQTSLVTYCPSSTYPQNKADMTHFLQSLHMRNWDSAAPS